MCVNGYDLDWGRNGPTACRRSRMLPQEKWESNNYGAGPSDPGCGSAQIRSVQQYLPDAGGTPAPRRARTWTTRPRAKLTSRRSSPISTASRRPRWASLVSGSKPARCCSLRPSRVANMRGVATATAAFSLSRTSGITQGQTMDALTGTHSRLRRDGAQRPAQRKVHRGDPPVAADPAWQAAIADHNARIARGAAQEIADAQGISEYNDYVSLIRKEVTDMRARSDEKRQREFSGEVIRGRRITTTPTLRAGGWNCRTCMTTPGGSTTAATCCRTMRA